MTSRERVLAVFNRQIPDRVPVWCGASPEFMEKVRKHLGVSDDEAVYSTVSLYYGCPWKLDCQRVENQSF